MDDDATVGALFEARRFAEAVEPARRACEMSPDDVDAWRAYGVALTHAHDWRTCLEACRRAMELAPDDCEGPRWNAGIATTTLTPVCTALTQIYTNQKAAEHLIQTS